MNNAERCCIVADDRWDRRDAVVSTDLGALRRYFGQSRQYRYEIPPGSPHSANVLTRAMSSFMNLLRVCAAQLQQATVIMVLPTSSCDWT